MSARDSVSVERVSERREVIREREFQGMLGTWDNDRERSLEKSTSSRGLQNASWICLGVLEVSTNERLMGRSRGNTFGGRDSRRFFPPMVRSSDKVSNRSQSMPENIGARSNLHPIKNSSFVMSSKIIPLLRCIHASTCLFFVCCVSVNERHNSGAPIATSRQWRQTCERITT